MVVLWLKPVMGMCKLVFLTDNIKVQFRKFTIGICHLIAQLAYKYTGISPARKTESGRNIHLL